MNWIAKLMIGLKSLLQKQRVERELDEELQGFMEASAAHKQIAGMTAEAAHRAAMVEMGSRNAVKHQVWSSRWESTLEGLLHDTRVSMRMLARSPAFTAIALLSLALGIGGNTAIFTLINQVMLRNLPVRNPEQLVTFGNENGGGEAGGIDMGAYGLFPWYFARRLQTDPGPFQGIASFCSFSDKVSIRLPGADGAADFNAPAILAPANLVSGNYFSVLGAQPFMGRAITSSDDATPGSGAVVDLSHHFWQQSLSSDPAILGKTIRINGTPFNVIGVMPQGFHGLKQELEPPDLWAPMTMQTDILKQLSMLTPGDGIYFLDVFGRLSSQAASNKSARAQSQNWLDQQIQTATRAREGAKATPARDTKSGNPRDTDPVRMTYIPLAQIDPFVPVDSSTRAPTGDVARPAVPEENQDRFAFMILVRTTGDPAHTISDLRAAVASVDPNLPLIRITTIHDQMSNFMTHDELISSLTGLFSLLALLLAAIGLYGVMSYNVVRRTNEIGLRIALGAQTSAVQWMILSESLLLLAMGVGLGLPLTLLAAKYIKDQLFGLGALDPMTFTIALTVVSVMTLLAAWLPARRATKVDPTVALRCD